MTSLTREALLALKPEPRQIEVEDFGVVFIKPLTELVRSRRLAELFDEKGKQDKATKEKRRANMIIDQVCDEKGEPLFSQSDLNQILELDGAKLDKIVFAILDFNSEVKRNHRLRWAFIVCQKLKIDDPVHWMNAVSPTLLDQWIAFEIVQRESGESTEMEDVEDAREALNSMVNKWQR